MSFHLPKFDSSSLPKIFDSSSVPQLDDAAADLQAKADEVLSTTGTDEEAAKTGGKREAIRNIAHIVKEQAGKGLGTSKDYLSKVVDQVSTYAGDATATASTQLADAKEKGITQLTAAKESANVRLGAAKESATTQLAGLQTNLNKAIAQGQGTDTTDRGLSSEDSEPLKFPFNIVAWCASLCSGKSTTTTTSTDAAPSSTSKDFSIESLQIAAATLTETFTHEAESAVQQAREQVESSESPVSEVDAIKEEVTGST